MNLKKVVELICDALKELGWESEKVSQIVNELRQEARASEPTKTKVQPANSPKEIEDTKELLNKMHIYGDSLNDWEKQNVARIQDGVEKWGSTTKRQLAWMRRTVGDREKEPPAEEIPF